GLNVNRRLTARPDVHDFGELLLGSGQAIFPYDFRISRFVRFETRGAPGRLVLENHRVIERVPDGFVNVNADSFYLRKERHETRLNRRAVRVGGTRASFASGA